MNFWTNIAKTDLCVTSAEFPISYSSLSTDENQIQPDLTVWKCPQVLLPPTSNRKGKFKAYTKAWLTDTTDRTYPDGKRIKPFSGFSHYHANYVR